MRTLKWFAVVLVLSLVFTGAGTDGGSPDIELPWIASVSEVNVGGLVVRNPELVSQLTGEDSPSRTHEPWNIYGTDLGFSIEHEDKLYLVFGDTWGRDDSEGDDWRSSTMVVVEPDPVHGYVITEVVADENGEAKELLPSLKDPGTEYTVLPTSGVSLDGRIYLHYISINDWEQTWWDYKYPAPNGAGLAYSDDDGETWVKSETVWWPGDTAFTQAAMVEDGDYIYMFGTPAGRFGAARLLRAPDDELLDPDEYEYWDGDDWSSDPALAAEVVPAPVGELSVRWSPYHERWLMMYKNEIDHTIVVRTAEELEGPWDEERVIVTAHDYPRLYAPFMLPVEGPEVYFTMSMFRPYQVFVMRFTLEAAGPDDPATSPDAPAAAGLTPRS